MPDPLFFFAGGPGQSATETALLMWPVFSRIVGQRDIVLIDQRGTGKSTPLDCPQDEALSLTTDDDLLVQKTRECLENLSPDVRFFTSRLGVEDVEFVRQALGYTKINLMGVSYGTRMAQLVLREHPDSVRSILLDGVIPLETVIGVNFAASLQQGFSPPGCRMAGLPADLGGRGAQHEPASSAHGEDAGSAGQPADPGCGPAHAQLQQRDP
nr:alpha/beta fold hydrolase [Thiolapillus sp.]